MQLVENLKNILEKLYGSDESTLLDQLKRYNSLLDSYKSKFDDNDIYLFSTPGRTEIGGNHTDHNLGKVITASISIDSIAVVSKNNENSVELYSEGYDKPFKINLNDLEVVEEEKGTTNSLIRGIANRFVQLGHKIGGFNGVITSDVLPGSGLSSSASVEVLFGKILSSLYNDGNVSNLELAKIGQWSENNYFGKPCGLMDQLGCALGGIIAIDFENPDEPKIEQLNYDFNSKGYKLIILDTGGNHVDLTDDYAAVPNEMKSVAKFYDKTVCRELSYDLLFSKIDEARKVVGDRAILRAYHFLQENERVDKQVDSLKENDFSKFLNYINESGNSSHKWLQNIYSTKNVNEQGVTLALALTKSFINKIGDGACRVHGGGFAGTIQVILPINDIPSYNKQMESIFGKGKIINLSIRQIGSVCLNNL